MGGRPRSMRSLLITFKTCWSTGRVPRVASGTFIGPTPSCARPLLMAVSQSLLSGGMLADGFAGGRIPVAAAGPLEIPAAMKLIVSAPLESRSVAIRRRAWVCTLSSPLLTLLWSRQYGEGGGGIEWDY